MCLNGGGAGVSGYFEHLNTRSGYVKQLCGVLHLCACVRVFARERFRRKKIRRRRDAPLTPRESEKEIKLPVPLSEVAIPRSGVQFHLCHV